MLKPTGNCNHCLENSRLQTGHFEMPHFPCSELQRLDLTHLYQNYSIIRCWCDRRICPQATVTTVWKTPVCKRGVLKCPVSYVLNFRGWIKLIYDKITLIYSVKNAFNPTSEVQNIENGVFQNAPFSNAPFSRQGLQLPLGTFLLTLINIVHSTLDVNIGRNCLSCHWVLADKFNVLLRCKIDETALRYNTLSLITYFEEKLDILTQN